MSFDFYDDWDNEEEDAGLLGWGNDEYDGLLAGSRAYGATNTQPGRQRAMSYGARRGNRRRSQPREEDPTIIPASSYWGFLGNWTGKLGGGKNLRYKPSAADLQDHPGLQRTMPEGAPLLEEDEDGDDDEPRGHKRVRSNTHGSANTTDTLSSRGDIFPSEDELDDAVPLDDEFAMVLERRTTGSGADDESSGRKGKRPSAGSRLSTRTMSSRSSRNSKPLTRTYSNDSLSKDVFVDEEPKTIPSMAELRQEEETAQKEEEAAIAQRREAAQRLAAEHGLDGNSSHTVSSLYFARLLSSYDKSNISPQSLATEKILPPPLSNVDETLQVTPTSEPSTPFPAFDPAFESLHVEHALPASETASEPSDAHSADGEFNPAQLPRL